MALQRWHCREAKPTLVEAVRTMLADSNLPHRFWAEALSTAVYLRNRSPTKALSGITPYEAWNGTKPYVSILRIFGCCVYAHVVKTERCKLDSKANNCVMLGYGTQQKGYRLFDLEHRKVIHSKDVVFDETKIPGLQKETTDKYVELKLEEEPIAEDCPTTTPKVSVPEKSSLNEQSLKYIILFLQNYLCEDQPEI